MPAPKHLEKLFAFLLPPACREHVLGDLHERYQSPKLYVLDALSVLGPVIISRIRRTTDFQVFLMEIFTVYLSYTTAAWYLAEKSFLYADAGFARLAVPAIVTGVALLICNAYSDPQQQSFGKPILQSAGSVSLAFLFQAVLFDTQSNLAVPFRIMLYGSFPSAVLVSTVRTLFPPVQTRPKFAPLNDRRPLQNQKAIPASSLQESRDRISEIQLRPKNNLIFVIVAALLGAALLVIYRIKTAG